MQRTVSPSAGGAPCCRERVVLCLCPTLSLPSVPDLRSDPHAVNIILRNPRKDGARKAKDSVVFWLPAPRVTANYNRGVLKIEIMALRRLRSPVLRSRPISSFVRPPGKMRLMTAQESDTVLPLTATLSHLSAYFSAYYCDQIEAESGNGRPVSDSYLELLLPFSTSSALREIFVKLDKFDSIKTIRYGKLFEVIDALAGDCGYRHCAAARADVGKLKDYYIVTASVDGMRAFSAINADEDLKLQAYLSWVGTSSMEVQINVIACPKNQQLEELKGSTKFIMVARSKNSGKFRIPPLDVPALARAQGQARADKRRQIALNSLNLIPPRIEEVTVIHQLFLDSQYLKVQKNSIMTSGGAASTIRKIKYMKHTVQRSVEVMHYQDRNIHGKIFGGYLMRKGFEIAFICGCLFTGNESKIAYHAVDDIQFVSAVSIGAFMEFQATAIYSRAPFVVVEVMVYDIDVTTAMKKKTNTMTFIFRSRDDPESLAEVQPRDYEEFISFLAGRRTLDRLVNTED